MPGEVRSPGTDGASQLRPAELQPVGARTRGWRCPGLSAQPGVGDKTAPRASRALPGHIPAHISEISEEINN